MPERVRITEVSPRDGLQNEPGVITTGDKVKLVTLLCATGVDEIEVTSFVNPKWVPQLADAGDVVRAMWQERTKYEDTTPLPGGEGPGVGFTWTSGRFHSPQAAMRKGETFRRGTIQYSTPPRDRNALARAAALRRVETGPEQAVWSLLRGKNLGGLKFRRQHPFGPFVLDFFCAEFGLAVELDGQSHVGNEAKAKDATRTEYLEAHGLTVLRFTNDLAIADLDSIAKTIRGRCERLYVEGNGWRPEPSEPHPRPLPSGAGSFDPVMSVLVPNERGLEELLGCGESAKLVRKVSVFTAASETFNKKNTNATIAESIERFRPVVERAHSYRMLVRGYISCVVACPFEGAVAPTRVAAVARQLVDLGVDEIDLGDTIGAGTPESTAAMLRAVRVELGDAWWNAESMTLHLHDTFGRAASCVNAALDLGVRSFDGSVAGLGGCPYASTPGKRAPGNISTETLVRTVHAAGYTTGVRLPEFELAGRFAKQIVERARSGATP